MTLFAPPPTTPGATPHSEFGGSIAARVLRCPASVRLVAKTPARLRRDTVYAQRGAALHAAMALLIERERALDSLAGETIGEYTITRDDVENALRPALAHVDALLNQPGAEYYLERRVAFPTIENAFGTLDLIVKIAGVANVVDHKFGAGVRVVARDDDGVNPQLAFYAAGARHSLPGFFAGVERLLLTILQPQTIEEGAELASSTEATPAELDDFVARYRAAGTRSGLRRIASGAPGAASAPPSRFAPTTPARSSISRNFRRQRRPLRPTAKPICACSPTPST